MYNRRMDITVISDNGAKAPYRQEHGLALALGTEGNRFLFDTGAGEALTENLRLTGFEPTEFGGVILSHGHDDHSGGLHLLPPLPLVCGRAAGRTRFSRHPDRPVRENGMRAADRAWTDATSVRVLTAPTRLTPTLTAIAPIPRITGEGTGGPFFLDAEGTRPDSLDDECALLTSGGTVIQGCCHAGLGNTLAACARGCPEVPIRAFVGGLHLSGATPKRIADTAARIEQAGIRTLWLMHCTGPDVVAELRRLLPACDIRTPSVGDAFSCP